MGKIVSFTDTEKVERINKNIREILHQNSYKHSHIRLVIFILIFTWFSVYGIWTFVNDMIKLIF